MSDFETANELRELIRSDEEILARIRKEEAEILDHISSVGFPSASSRAHLLSEMREVEERLHKNRIRLGST
ncbi:hypothetical protein HNQ77_002387 [Silvibacterium bohemicum]|uniref:Uncharacterized protein n=1 Tax=Silvibacterium bohemicum TaxID=1577686 RepID=A0A841JV74_9BACT|nr:hypothetical protein [Silvibacterium bohemicum]